MVPKKTTKREGHFWDPLFGSASAPKIRNGDWDLDTITGLNNHCISADIFFSKYDQYNRIKILDKSFSNCDFEGHFTEKKITFSKVVFKQCDFGECRWKDIKFSDCSFVECSFTLSIFHSCEFRNCYWEKIGISGNEMKLIDTIITNPGEFIDSSYTNLDPDTLARFRTTENKQLGRLAETKTKVARQLVTNLAMSGEEIGYYLAIEIYIKSFIEWKKWDCRRRILRKDGIFKDNWNRARLISAHVEYYMMNFAGLVNAWGGSVIRPFFIGCLIVLSFAALYLLFGVRSGIYSAFSTSIDITLLAGYTKHASKQDGFLIDSIFLANMLIGIIWYAIFVPTVINRISRVR